MDPHVVAQEIVPHARQRQPAVFDYLDMTISSGGGDSPVRRPVYPSPATDEVDVAVVGFFEDGDEMVAGGHIIDSYFFGPKTRLNSWSTFDFQDPKLPLRALPLPKA